jgi:hypothetical protein
VAKISKALDIPTNVLVIMGIEREDAPPDRRWMYDKLMPVILALAHEIVKEEKDKKRRPVKKKAVSKRKTPTKKAR